MSSKNLFPLVRSMLLAVIFTLFSFSAAYAVTLSGTVDVQPVTGGGMVFVGIFDAADPDPANILAGTAVTVSGTGTAVPYAIDLGAAGAHQVRVIGFYDKNSSADPLNPESDDNWADYGDVMGGYATPVTLGTADITNIDFAVSTSYAGTEGFHLYDDFSAADGWFDAEKWRKPHETLELVRKVASGQLVSIVRSAAGRQDNRALLNYAGLATRLKSDVLVDSFDTGKGGSSQARISAHFFNSESVNPDSVSGDVWAGLRIRPTDQGLLFEYSVYHYVDRWWNGESLGDGLVSLTPGSFSTWYQLEIELTPDPDHAALTFRVYDEFGTLLSEKTIADLPPYKAPAYENFKEVMTRTYSRYPESSLCTVAARFDNVHVNGTLHDDFDASDTLDPAKWQSTEFVRAIENQEAVMSVGSKGTRETNRLNMVRATANTSVDVKVDPESAVFNGSYGRARIEGYLYNDSFGKGPGRIYDGEIGEVWAQVHLDLLDDGTMSAGYEITRTNVEQPAAYPEDYDIPLIGEFSVFTGENAIQKNRNYRLGINFTGTQLILTCTDMDSPVPHVTDSVMYDIPGPAYTANFDLRGLTSRVYESSQENAGGTMTAHFDNVRVGNMLDSDGDGLSDFDEFRWLYDPFDGDMDGDGITDGNEDRNMNGRVDADETNPKNPDTDGDGITDGTEIGLEEAQLPEYADENFVPDQDPSTTTDPRNPDSDYNGILDGVADSNQNGRVDEGESDPNAIGTLQGIALYSDNNADNYWRLNAYTEVSARPDEDQFLTLMGNTTRLQIYSEVETWTHLPVYPAPSAANGQTVAVDYKDTVVSGRVAATGSEGFAGIIQTPPSYHLRTVSGGTNPIIAWKNEFNAIHPGYAPIDQYRIRVYDMNGAEVFTHQIRSDENDLSDSDQTFDFSTVGFSFTENSQYSIRVEAREYTEFYEITGADELDFFLVVNRSYATMPYSTDPDKNMIYGRVLDSLGNPVSGLWVQAFDNACGGNGLGGGRTDSQGYYIIDGIPPGNVYVQACAGCDDLMYTSHWWTGSGSPGSFDCNDAQNLNITAGINAMDIDFALDPAGGVSGRVVAEDGTPLEGIHIYAKTQQGDRRLWVSGTNTDAGGYYTLNSLPAGEVYVRACPGCSGHDYVNKWYDESGGTYDYNGVVPVTVTGNQIQAVMDFTLESAGSIDGYVKDDAGQGIAGVHVYVRSNACGGTQYSEADTDDQGYYRITGIPQGTVYVYACPECNGQNYVGEWYDSGSKDCSLAVGVPVVAGDTTSIGDFSLEPGRQLFFTINGDGVEGMHISVHDWHTGEFLHGDTVDASTYTLNAIPPASQGKYRVYLNSGDTYYLAQTYSDPVDPGQNLVFSPVEGAKIWGVVQGQDGDLLERVCINTSTTQCGMFIDGNGYTDENGNYSFIVPINTTLYLYANADCNDQIHYLSQYWTDSGNDYACDQASAIVINAAGTDTNINFTLPRGSTVSGQVLDHEDNPIEGLWVDAFDRACGGNGLGGEYTDSNGEYTILGIPPGDVYVQTCPSCDKKMYTGYWWTGSGIPGSFFCNEAQKLTITSAVEDVAGIDFALDPAGGVSGRLEDAEGKPIPYTHVYAELQEEDNIFWVSGTSTDASGEYVLTGIPAGNAYVRACPGCNGYDYVNKWYDGGEGTMDHDSALLIPISTGDIQPEINFTLESAGSLDGYVRDGSGEGIPGVHVYVRSDACGGIQYSETNTDNQGYFRISGVPEGEVYVYACPECNGQNFVGEWYNGGTGTQDCEGAAAVTMNIPETTIDDFWLAPGAKISGIVGDVNGDPVTGTSVHVVLKGGDPCGDNYQVGWADTNPDDGSYVIVGIQEGTYYLRTWPGESHYVGEWYDGGTGTRDCNEAQRLVINTGQTLADKDFFLEEGGYVSGRVSDTDETGIPNLWVEAFSGKCWDQFIDGNKTDANGDYTIGPIPQSTVYIHACSSCNNKGYVDEWYNGGVGTRDCNAAQGISVTKDATTFLNEMVLDPGHKLTVTVTGDDVAGIDISIHDFETGEYLISHWIDKSPFTFWGVPGASQGSYKVYLNSGESFYVGEAYPNPVSPDDAIVFIPVKGGRVAGTITGGGQVRSNICVSAEETGCGNHIHGSGTHSNGVYGFALLPGEYSLRAEPACNPDADYFYEYWTSDGGVSRCESAEPVTVVMETETIANFDLEPGGLTMGDCDADGDIDGRDLTLYLERLNSEDGTVIVLEDLAHNFGMK